MHARHFGPTRVIWAEDASRNTHHRAHNCCPSQEHTTTGSSQDCVAGVTGPRRVRDTGEQLSHTCPKLPPPAHAVPDTGHAYLLHHFTTGAQCEHNKKAEQPRTCGACSCAAHLLLHGLSLWQQLGCATSQGATDWRRQHTAQTLPSTPTDCCAAPTPRCHRSPLPRRKRASFMFAVSVVALVSLAYVTAATVTLRARWLTCRRSKSSKSMCPPSMSSRPPSCPVWPPQTGLVGEWSQTACSTWPCCCHPLRDGTARHRPWAPLCWT